MAFEPVQDGSQCLTVMGPIELGWGPIDPFSGTDGPRVWVESTLSDRDGTAACAPAAKLNLRRCTRGRPQPSGSPAPSPGPWTRRRSPSPSRRPRRGAGAAGAGRGPWSGTPAAAGCSSGCAASARWNCAPSNCVGGRSRVTATTAPWTVTAWRSPGTQRRERGRRRCSAACRLPRR